MLTLQRILNLPFSIGAFFNEDSKVAIAFRTKLISAIRCLKQIITKYDKYMRI